MISRGFSAFLGGFTLLNLLGGLLAPGFDANIWWIDFSPLPGVIARVSLFFGGIALLSYAMRPPRGRARLPHLLPIALLALVALGDSLRFYRLLFQHHISAGVPLPLSAVICAGLLVIAWKVAGDPRRRNVRRRSRAMTAGRDWRTALVTFAVCLVAFPLAQMYFFGHTDYRRKADAIVVFGARAHADGSPSEVLSDRVATACQLYRDGWANLVVFSGGPGDGAIDEAQAMRRMALGLGVPDRAIRMDHQGLNTAATVSNTGILFRRIGVKRVLAVSHSYHLPRIKLAYQQAGWDVYTVPAIQHYRLPGGGRFLVARETAALWAYYLRCGNRQNCGGH